MALDLSNIQAVVSDMDGVLWRGTETMPHAIEFFTYLAERGIPFVLATNNSGRHPEYYAKRLLDLGFPKVEPWQIVTSGTATASYLHTQYEQGTRLYVTGNEGLKQVLTEAGFVVAEHEVQAVVSGIDFNFTYDIAVAATTLIRGGAAFIGTNGDLTFPTATGLAPGAGSILAMIEAATDVKPTVIGKPEVAMFEAALRAMNATPQATLMLGDRLNTDISGAHAAGLKSAFVLTGVHTTQHMETLGITPDAIFNDLGELLAAWQNA